MSEPYEVDDHCLMAYLDGELAQPETEALERVLADDPRQEARLRELAFADSMLRASMRGLAARHDRGSLEPDLALPRVVPFRRRRVLAGRAMAAGLALAIGAGAVGFSMRPALLPTGDASHAAQRQTRSSTLHNAALQAGLENDVSGQERTWQDPASGAGGGIVPVRSWRNATGRFCREFDAWHGSGAEEAREGGVACRDAAGLWRVRLRYYPE